MSRTYEILEQVEWSRLKQGANDFYEKYKALYKQDPIKADKLRGEPLLRELRKKRPEIAAKATRKATPKVPKKKTPKTPLAIQKAGQELRKKGTSNAGEILGRGNTKSARELNKQIAAYRLRKKGFGPLNGVCGYGSNEVML